MIRFLISLFLLAFSLNSFAQQVQVGAQKEFQSYYKLGVGQVKQVALDDWDIAIEPTGDYGLRINEAIGTRLWVKTTDIRQNCLAGTNCRGLQDYVPALYDTTGMMSGANNWVELHNNYENWRSGAFNQETDPTGGNILDYGWGAYKAFSSDPAHAIIGYRIFIIQLANGTFKQVFVRKSTSAGYEFAYANIDGSNVQEQVFSRTGFTNKLFAYHNIRTGITDSLDPVNEDWDLLVTTYPWDKVNGNTSQRLGVLINHGHEAEELRDVDVNCATGLLYSSDANTIGTDWYESDPHCSCESATDSLLYMIRRPSGDEFRLVISQLDFVNGLVDFSAASQTNTALTANLSSSAISCVACADGTASAFVSGGACPYTYSWSNGAIESSINGLSPGWYTLTVTDQNGNSVTDSVEVDDFDCSGFSFAQESITDISCNGQTDGAISISLSGGEAPFSYAWNHGPTSANLNNLSAGTYDLTVTDANGCFVVGSYQVNEPSALSLNITKAGPSCPTCSDASLTAVVNGGTAPYSYSWTNGDTDDEAENLAQGTYSVTVTDANGCTVSGTETTDPFGCSVMLQASNMSKPSCVGASDGAIELAASGSSGYEYGLNGANYSSNNTFGGLSAGIYLFVAKDFNGCTDTLQVTLEDPSALSLNTNKTQPLCFGDQNGGLEFSPSGGTGPYLINFSGSGFTSLMNYQGIPAGTYSIELKDANGCVLQENVNLTEPGTLGLQISGTAASCGVNDGSLDLTGSGGAGNFSYSLDGNNYQPSGLFANLAAGTYPLWMQDQNGCILRDTGLVPTPDSLQINQLTTADIDCHGDQSGVIAVGVSGGSSPYQYKLNQGNFGSSNIFTGLAAGQYLLTIKDANQCETQTTATINEPDAIAPNEVVLSESCAGDMDGSVVFNITGGTGSKLLNFNNAGFGTQTQFTQLAAGIYPYEIQDDNNCLVQGSIEITAAAPLALQVVQTKNLSCFNNFSGEVHVSATGGRGNYTYSIDGGAFQASADFFGLTAGNHVVVLKDSSSCVDSIAVSLTQPARININIANVQHESCAGANDAFFTIQASNGQGNLSYSIGNGFQSSPTFTNLTAGTYNYTVKDDSNCTRSSVIQITSPPAITLQNQQTVPTSCHGGTDGSIDVLANGGAGTFAYQLNGGNSQGSGLFTGLQAGTYNLNVTDGSGCSEQFSITVNQPDSLDLTLVGTTNVLCHGDTTGNLFVLGNGGTSGYQYSLDGVNFQPNGGFGDLAAGTYNVIVKDANGCTDNLQVTLTENPAFNAVLSSTQATCSTCPDGTASIAVTGATAPYSYFWNTGSTQPTATGLLPGFYPVQVTDANGCKYRDTVEVTNGIGLEELQVEFEFYPNPVDDFVVVNSSLQMEVLSLYTVDGRLVKRWEVQRSLTEQLDLSGLEAASYILRVEGERYSESNLLIVR